MEVASKTNPGGVCQVYKMSGKSSKTPLFSISRVGFLEDRWSLIHFLDVCYILEMLLFKVSRMTARSSMTPLTYFLDVCYVLMSYFKFQDVRKVIKDSLILHLQSWILGGQLVPFLKQVMSWRCYISNFRYLGCQKGHQRHPQPPSLELDPLRTGGS